MPERVNYFFATVYVTVCVYQNKIRAMGALYVYVLYLCVPIHLNYQPYNIIYQNSRTEMKKIHK